jgi:hypothetical protein
MGLLGGSMGAWDMRAGVFMETLTGVLGGSMDVLGGLVQVDPFGWVDGTFGQVHLCRT